MKMKTAITFAVGVFAGIALCGPAAQASGAITAVLSDQPIYVNGQLVAMTAYSIGGNNYVKLRDIGKAVDLAVDYDGSTNSVHINTALPYQEEVTLPAQPIQTPPAPVPGDGHTISAASWSREDFSQWADPPCSPAYTTAPCITPSGRPWWTADRAPPQPTPWSRKAMTTAR